MKSQELTAADHVVVFKSSEQANKVAYVAANYNRAAILVRNFNGETHIIKAFETKKAAIEAKKDGSINSQLSVVTRNDSTHSVNFYNIIGAAHAISGSGNDDVLVETDHPTKQHLKGVYGKLYAKIATPESQPVIQEIPESQEVVEIADKPIEHLPESVQVCGRGINNEISGSVKLLTTLVLIDIEQAEKAIRIAKSGDLVYAEIGEKEVMYCVSIPEIEQIRAESKMDFDLSELCRLKEIRDDETFVFEEVACPTVIYLATVDLNNVCGCPVNMRRIKHPSGKGWIYFDLPQGFDPLKPCDFIAISDAYDLHGNEYSLEFGDGDDNVIDFNKPIRVYGIDMVWGGVRREKVCICRHPDLDECDDDDDGFKPPRICQPLEPWLQIDNDGNEELFDYAY